MSQKANTGSSGGHRDKAARVFQPWGWTAMGTVSAPSTQTSRPLPPKDSTGKLVSVVGRESPLGAVGHKNAHGSQEAWSPGVDVAMTKTAVSKRMSWATGEGESGRAGKTIPLEAVKKASLRWRFLS